MTINLDEGHEAEGALERSLEAGADAHADVEGGGVRCARTPHPRGIGNHSCHFGVYSVNVSLKL
jgi:hypothetical protein